MNVHLLVDRIAEALGPDATAARVEAVAAAVLETAPERPKRKPGNLVIITAFGLDRPGILAGVTNVVSEAGCNITDVSQRIVREYFTLIMIADIEAMTIPLADLQHRLREAGKGLGVRVNAQHEDLFAGMHRP